MAERDQQLHGYVAAGLSVLAALAMIAVLDRLGRFETTTFIALIFLPLIAYAVFSGAVTEISGPGGWAAKFRTAARRAVDIDDEIEALNLVGKASLRSLDRQIDRLAPRGSVALQFISGKGAGAPRYDPGAVHMYLDALRRIDPRMVIVVVDKDKKFQASTDVMSLERLQAIDSLMPDFLKYLKDEDFTAMRTLLPLTSQSVRRGQSNAEALHVMLQDKVETLVVTDEFERPVGVIRRDKIVARLMAELDES